LYRKVFVFRKDPSDAYVLLRAKLDRPLQNFTLCLRSYTDLTRHVCASWESTTGIAEFWFNGKPWPRKGLQRGYTVGAEAAILLGQEQDTFGGGFDVYNSFSGELADVYLWDAGLSPDKMRAAYQSLSLPPA
ncbi:PREDICTED: serum amyloid P-component, partial [Tauraco erythrolophus]|uniref:serum amyloid P-component n=1 Tax=Tauraco erythrolophus TaxID=121530 RepID=UPI000523964A